MLKSHQKSIQEILGRNPIHPFPARMAPGIALEALGESGQSMDVLDPMMGSGTVLAVARAEGHRALGIDIDPLAVLLATVWTRTTDPDAMADRAKDVLAKAKRLFRALPVGSAYPPDSDRETRQFIRYWFDDYSRRQLAALASAIGQIPDGAAKDVLWCGFSRLIITKSAGASLAMDLSHSRPHKVFETAPIKPFSRFIAAVKIVAQNCPHASNGPVGPRTNVRQGDARRLQVPSESIDLVLTSPPYLNAIDYMRCSKFSLVWMGYTVSEMRRIRGESIGAEVSFEEAADTEWVRATIRHMRLSPRLSSRHNGLLARYVFDMGNSLSEVSRVLRPSGRAVYVVGDSTVRGTFIRNSLIVSEVAQRHKLKLVSRQTRALPANRRYLPPPKLAQSGDLHTRMRREVVLAFQK